MEYRAVGNRCAVNLMDLPVPPAEARNILQTCGFKELEVNIIGLARALVGVAQYRRGARLHEAPKVFDCSGFTKYLWGQLGIWLPRRSIQQRDYGYEVGLGQERAGDLIFCTGRINYFHTDPNDGVGHAGLTTSEGTVIHAANRSAGVVETSLENFIGEPANFRGIRRLVPSEFVTTLEIPPTRDVETSGDLTWIIRQQLPRCRLG